MSDEYMGAPSINLSQTATNVTFSDSGSVGRDHLATGEMVKFSKRIKKDPSTSNPNQIT